MLSRKMQNTVLNSNTNLKHVLITNVCPRRYFFRCNLMIHDKTITDVLRTIYNVTDKMKFYILNGIIFRTLQNSLHSTPRNLNDCSAGVLRVWAHQCECVFAQRVRRGQQMFCLYTKLWGEKALKDLLNGMKLQITKRGKEFVFSAIGIASYNWDKNRISNEEILKYMDELDFIHLLSEKTLICEICKKERHKTPAKDGCCCCLKKDLQKKSFENWTTFVEKKDMVVWRKQQDCGYYEYKVYGSFNDVTAEDFLNVQIDTEYRKTWDTTAITLEVIDKDPVPYSNSDIIYWEMLWPKLFINRDYVFNRRFIIDSKTKTIILISQGTKHPACPVRPDKYRVDTYWSYMVIKPYTDLDKPGIEFGLTYFDDPGVNIPSAVTTWVAMRAMPDFLARLRIATKEYKSYCEKTTNKYVYSIQKDAEPIKEEKQDEEKNDEQDDSDEFIIDNTIFEAQPSIRKNYKNNVKSRSGQTKDPFTTVPSTNTNSKSSMTPGTEIMTSPSPTMQAETSRTSYWKYLHLNYYFS